MYVTSLFCLAGWYTCQGWKEKRLRVRGQSDIRGASPQTYLDFCMPWHVDEIHHVWVPRTVHCCALHSLYFRPHHGYFTTEEDERSNEMHPTKRPLYIRLPQQMPMRIRESFLTSWIYTASKNSKRPFIHQPQRSSQIIIIFFFF